jgi:glycosyltransferase involved in cell wall biosynthesis
MKALILSKALLAASYRQKLTALARLGVEVTAVVPSRWKEGGRLQLLEPGLDGTYRVVVTEVRFTGHFHAHYYPDLARIVREEQPDLIHLDEEPYNLATFLGARIASRANVPSLFFAWQNINRRYPLPFRLTEKYVYRHAAHALAGNQDARRVLREKGFRPDITVVPQFGVDPDTFRPQSSVQRHFTVGFVNRLVEAKGPMVALDALLGLPPDVGMCIVGDGPLRSRIQSTVRSRGLTDRVDLKARIPSTEMPELLASLSVIILPSLTSGTWKEQFGRILIEAMSCGIPVIGSDSGEIPNVIGDAGLIVPEGDVRALAGAIRAIQTDAALRADLSQRGRERVLKKFTHAHVAELTAAAYSETLSSWNIR